FPVALLAQRAALLCLSVGVLRREPIRNRRVVGLPKRRAKVLDGLARARRPGRPGPRIGKTRPGRARAARWAVIPRKFRSLLLDAAEGPRDVPAQVNRKSAASRSVT